ncbi:MAG: TetR/AcrR family transcriptional regulator [Blastococcus sp.]
MGELGDRRARKKAQTRQLIRSVAQRRFDEFGFEAVTIADIARECDVAVQTVFNHFATKEELFFDGRASWVDGPAQAVRSRQPGVPPLTALRAHLVDVVAERIGGHRCPERRRTIATLEASDALRAHERLLMHEAEVRLRHALLETWASEGTTSPPDPEPAALLIAAVWVAAAGSLVLGQRPSLTAGADPEVTAATTTDLADRVLRQLELGANAVHGRTPLAAAPPTETGWPHTVLRAG